MTTTEKVYEISDKIKEGLSDGKHTHEVLTEMLGISPNSLYKYKRTDEWPRVVQLAVDNVHSKMFGQDDVGN